jgi:hypothetical protein
VGPVERGDDALARLHRCFTPGFRLGTGPQTGRADLHLGRSETARERLGIGIDGDELDAADALANHVVDGVAARAPDAEHFDDRALVGGIDQFFNPFDRHDVLPLFP